MPSPRTRRAATMPPAEAPSPYASQGEQVAALTERLEATREQVRSNKAAEKIMPDRDVLLEEIAVLKAEVARTRQATHDIRGNQQMRIAADVLAAKSPVAQKLSFFQTIIAVISGIVGLGVVAAGLLSAYTSRQIDYSALQAKITLLDSKIAEMSPVPGQLLALSGRFEQATRNRDQQEQAMKDRLRGLELSDQSGAERLQALAQSIAGLLPRVDEILRRQERLESRLGSAARPGVLEDAPTVWRQSIPSRT